MLIRLLIFFWLILMSSSKMDRCNQWISEMMNDANYPKFSEAQIRLACRHNAQWNIDEKTKASRSFLDSPTSNQLKYLQSVEMCTRQNCVREGQRRKKRQTNLKTIRKEIRMMSEQELRDLGEAMNNLKHREIDNITAWDLHTLVHYPDSAPGAHWGPAFLPWHREFLRQFEIALQTEVPNVALPYWDSTLDQGLPEESDSVLWTGELLGNGNGYVKTGPFANWDTNVYMPLSQIPVKKLYRSTGGREQDRLMTPRDAKWVTSRANFSQLTFCHDKTLETMHGLSHVWVGGFMYVIRVSPNDPAFYMHHAFIDNLWEQFRNNQQTREERETQWAKKICNQNHAIDAQMKPFNMRNRDGLANYYTDEWYEYEQIRHCSIESAQCSSRFLWCDTREWRCRSKVVLGGNCTGYEGTHICYKSTCIAGTCQLPPRIKQRGGSGSSDGAWGSEIVFTKTILLDENGKGIEEESSVRVTDIETNIEANSTNTPHKEFPNIPGTVFIALPKPNHERPMRRLELAVTDQFGRYCQSQCYNSTVERYQVCQPLLNVTMHEQSDMSPISFTHSMTSRNYLDVDMSIHPKTIKPSLPYIVFVCARKLVTSAMITSLVDDIQPPLISTPTILFRVAVQRQPFTDYKIQVTTDDRNYIWAQMLSESLSIFDPNVAMVQAPNPEYQSDGVRIQVSILDVNDKPVECIIKCTLKDGSTKPCDGRLNLHTNPLQSDEDVFASTDNSSAVGMVLGWRMIGHPNQWRHKMPFLNFHC